jgi:hypothetical protein
MDPHDLRMYKPGERLPLCKELGDILLRKMGPQNFESGRTFQIEMLSQIHFCKAASSEQAYKTIIA